MKPKPSGISNPTYNSILKDLSQIYEQSLTDGNQDWNKTVLSSNWRMGEIIIKIQAGKDRQSGYGDKVLTQLSKDLNQKYGKGFSDRNLRPYFRFLLRNRKPILRSLGSLEYMRKFYQTYRMNQIHSELSWSHYRCLLLIEDSRLRMELEKKAIKEALSQRDLLIRVKQVLGSSSKKEKAEIGKESMNYRLKRPLLRLNTYQLKQKFSQDSEHSVPHLDLGFSVYQTGFENLSQFKVGSILSSTKKGKSYSFQITSSTKELFTYKAFLLRVIDGDTLQVRIDLGFSIVIEQRLRLRGLDAPELGTGQGKSPLPPLQKGVDAKRFVESRLKDCKFLIIKTHGSDKYDRYLVDVFYLNDEDNEDKVLREGNFLNNEILEEGLALLVL